MLVDDNDVMTMIRLLSKNNLIEVFIEGPYPNDVLAEDVKSWQGCVQIWVIMNQLK